MTMPRTLVHDFALANPIYRNATATFYRASNGVKTNVLATLYEEPSGSEQLSNPQLLDSRGKLRQPVYIDRQCVITITGLTIPTHDTGIINPAPIFRVNASTGNLEYSYDDGLTYTSAGSAAGLGLDTTCIMQDDFTGDSLDVQWGSAAGSDPQVVAPAIAAAVGGTVVMTTGDDAAASMAVNGVQLVRSLIWSAENGGLTFKARVKLSSIANVQLFVGLTDTLALEAPFTLGAADALTSNASNAVGFLFDTGADTDTIHLVGVAADVDATKQNTGQAPVAGTYLDLQIDVTDAGVATFRIDGTAVGTSLSGAITPATLLTPYVGGFSRAAASVNITADYVMVKQDR